MNTPDAFDHLLANLRPVPLPESLAVKAQQVAQIMAAHSQMSPQSMDPAQAMNAAMVAHEMAMQPWLYGQQNRSLGPQPFRRAMPPPSPMHPMSRPQGPTIQVLDSRSDQQQGGMVAPIGGFDQGGQMGQTVSLLPMSQMPPMLGISGTTTPSSPLGFGIAYQGEVIQNVEAFYGFSLEKLLFMVPEWAKKLAELCGEGCGNFVRIHGPTKRTAKAGRCTVVYYETLIECEKCWWLVITDEGGKVLSKTSGTPKAVDPGPPPIRVADFPDSGKLIVGGPCTTGVPLIDFFGAPLVLLAKPFAILVDCDDLRFIQVKKRKFMLEYCDGTAEPPDEDAKWLPDNAGEASYPGFKNDDGNTTGMSDTPGDTSYTGFTQKGKANGKLVKKTTRITKFRTYIYCDGKLKGIRKWSRKLTLTFTCTDPNFLDSGTETEDDAPDYVSKKDAGKDERDASGDQNDPPMGQAYPGSSAVNPPPAAKDDK